MANRPARDSLKRRMNVPTGSKLRMARAVFFVMKPNIRPEYHRWFAWRLKRMACRTGPIHSQKVVTCGMVRCDRPPKKCWCRYSVSKMLRGRRGWPTSCRLYSMNCWWNRLKNLFQLMNGLTYCEGGGFPPATPVLRHRFISTLPAASHHWLSFVMTITGRDGGLSTTMGPDVAVSTTTENRNLTGIILDDTLILMSWYVARDVRASIFASAFIREFLPMAMPSSYSRVAFIALTLLKTRLGGLRRDTTKGDSMALPLKMTLGQGCFTISSDRRWLRDCTCCSGVLPCMSSTFLWRSAHAVRYSWSVTACRWALKF
mmetsp:Transcript_34163/g.85754  ORF Transcript_34163/g.85754 Transcript_34163/m.85754 type:complete len:316 (-) Transcript_34163:162-1109(-)